ncbi:MAG: metallophosphoesterase [Planctomycetota bacterium]|jgi:predicted phosphohydrolase
MRIWALSDLHLSLASDKPMDIFGDHWRNHHQTMAAHWDSLVADDDIVLSPGDFSWAGKPDAVAADFAWLAQRPGHKVLIKGNHDHWWPKSQTKLNGLLPPRTYAIKKRACRINGLSLFGARGGDFAPLKRYGDSRSQEAIDTALAKEEQELQRSLEHLEQLEREGSGDGPWQGLRICLFHYPPLPPGANGSRFTRIISEAGAAFCIYGHLHGSDASPARFEGTIAGTQYRCASCDQIGFTPTLIAEHSAESRP